MRIKASELIGKRFGKLTALSVGRNDKDKVVVVCSCECGKECFAYPGHLKEGRRVSCGCNSKNPRTHGMRRTKIYSIWCDMVKRCSNPSSISYRWYGEKGITVCDHWLKFENFFADMGEPPEGFSIDRINPKGNYEPNNCRWADSRTQVVNRSCQKMYLHNGVEMTLPEIANLTGIKYRTLRSRLFRTGMTLDEAITHYHGEITEKGMNKLKSAVISSNIRRGQTSVTASKGIR